jgi:hypothetical protein
MTKSQRHKSAILLKLREFGWEQDRWGHFKKPNKNGNLLRVKVQKRSLRLEGQHKIGNKNEWVRISSDFFGKIKIEDHGVVIGGVRIKEPKVKVI